MNSQEVKNKSIGDAANVFAQSIRQEINEAAENVDSALGKKLENHSNAIESHDSSIAKLEQDLHNLSSELGSMKNDVANGNGVLRTFTIPKKKGTIRFIVGGEKIEAQVDENGNVTGKHVASKNIQTSQVEVTLNRPIDKDTTVSFVAGGINDAFKDISELIEKIQRMQIQQNETIVNVQKSFDDTDGAIKSKLNETIAEKKELEAKIDLQKTEIDKLKEKIEGINRKFKSIATIMNNESKV